MPEFIHLRTLLLSFFLFTGTREAVISPLRSNSLQYRLDDKVILQTFEFPPKEVKVSLNELNAADSLFVKMYICNYYPDEAMVEVTVQNWAGQVVGVGRKTVFKVSMEAGVSAKEILSQGEVASGDRLYLHFSYQDKEMKEKVGMRVGELVVR